MGRAGGTGWRCGPDTSGANRKVRLRGACAPGLVSRAPGRLRDSAFGYYGPCARSSLTARADPRDTQARPGAEKCRKVERREARFLDSKRKRHASQACRAASPAAHGASPAPAFPGAPLPLFGGSAMKIAHNSDAFAPRERERLSLACRTAARVLSAAHDGAAHQQHPQFLDRRAHRPRQVDARRPADPAHRRDGRARDGRQGAGARTRWTSSASAASPSRRRPCG